MDSLLKASAYEADYRVGSGEPVADNQNIAFINILCAAFFPRVCEIMRVFCKEWRDAVWHTRFGIACCQYNGISFDIRLMMETDMQCIACFSNIFGNIIINRYRMAKGE